MNAPRHVLLASIALVAAGAFSAYEYAHVRALELSLANATRAAANTAAPRPALPRPTPPPPPGQAPTAQSGELPERVKHLFETAPLSPGGVPMVRPEALFADMPTVKAAFNKAAEGQQRLGYAQFIRTVQLSADEEQRFIAILANREATWGDIRATATEQGVALADPIVAQMDQKNFAETEANLQALLGTQRYEQLQQYRETLDSRLGLYALNTLVTTSYGTSEPLTLEQMNRLAKLTTDTGVMSYEQARKMPDGPQFDRALAEAEKFLTPAQMDVFGLLMDYRQITHAQTKIFNDRPR